MKSMRLFTSNRLVTVLAAAFTPGVVFLLAANAIIVRNIDELPYNVDVVLRFIIAFLVAWALLLPLFLLSTRYRIASVIVRLLVLAGISVFLSDLLGIVLDGMNHLLFLAITDTVLIIALGALLFRIRIDVLLPVLGLLTLLILASGITDHYFNTANARKSLSESAARSKPAQGSDILKREGASARGNVYHIVFDSYQKEAYQYSEDREKFFESFTFFPNFRTNSGRTWTSIPQMFLGEYYPKDIKPNEWRKEFAIASFAEQLIDNGINVHLYPFYKFHCHPDVPCRSTVGLKEEHFTGIRSSRTIIDLWFQKLLPHSVNRYINREFLETRAKENTEGMDWNYGFSIVDWVDERRGKNPENQPKDSDLPHFSVIQFQEFLDDEDARPSTGQYVFIHPMLPHGPHIVDRDCKYIGNIDGKEGGIDRYMQQVDCANKLSNMLLSKLKELGRLDDSLIIIQADHGKFWHPRQMESSGRKLAKGTGEQLNQDKIATSAFPSEMIEARASALLMIRGLSKESAPPISDAWVQMVDIGPTILKFLRINPKPSSGSPIQDVNPDIERDRVFITTSHSATVNLFSEYRWIDGKWKFQRNLESH